MKKIHIKMISFVSIMLVFTVFSYVIGIYTKNDKFIGTTVENESFLNYPVTTDYSQIKSFDYALADSKGYDTEIVNGYTEMLKTEKYTLYFNTETAAIAFRDNSTRNLWYSNPSHKLDKEILLAGTAKQALMSQFSLTFYDYSNSKATMDSYNDSVLLGNMSYELTGDKLSVTYVVGKNTITLADVPQQMSEKRFEEFLSKLDSKDAKALKALYKKASLKGKTDESIIENYKKKYPNIENSDIYYIKNDSPVSLQKINQYLQLAGYTAEDLEKDNTENKIVATAEKNVKFTVVIEYSLNENGLNVTVDKNKLKYDSEILLTELSLLQTFGCGTTDDDGYMLLADGSGSLMCFNNGKNDNAFSMRVYGDDTAIATASHYQYDEKMSLPVFGIKKNKSAILAIIENGSEYATVQAATSGTTSSYNCANTVFTVSASDKISLGKGSELVAGEEKPYNGEFTMLYCPISNQDENYSGMASYYRNYLTQKGVLKKTKTKYTMLANIICGVPIEKNVLGFPTKTVEALTTFDEVLEITNNLSSAGVENISVVLEGWFNNGLEQQYLKNLKIPKSVGSKKELLALSKELEDKGIKLYNKVYFSNFFANGNGYNANKMNVKGIDKDLSYGFEYDFTSRYKRFNNKIIYQLTPILFKNTIELYIKKSNGLGDFGTAVSDLSQLIYSDFDDKKYITRSDAKNMISDSLEYLSQKGEVALANPNVFTLDYADLIIDLPLYDSQFKCCDMSVPFYQMVVHGSVNYVTKPLNYEDDYKKSYLKAVEYGSGLSYLFTGESTSILKNTDFNYINNSILPDNASVVAEDFKKACSIMEKVDGYSITSHSYIGNNVFRTEYENGIAVLVNYGEQDVIVFGTLVPSMDFVFEKGAE